MKQVQEDEFAENEASKAHGERGAYSFFALLCFLVAIIFLSIFLGNALDGFSAMLVLLGVLVFGLGGIYLLGQRPSGKSDQESSFSLEYRQHEDDLDKEIVEGTLIASAPDTFENEVSEEDNKNDDTEEDDYEDEDEGEDEEDDEENGDEDEDFVILVEEAMDSIPPEFRKRMQNLAVLVENEPDREVLQRVGTKEGYTLLGLYEGTPLTALGYQGAMLPERITIYQRTIEAYCHGDPERIRQQVRATLLHEVAHHFGIDHDEMPIWVK